MPNYPITANVFPVSGTPADELRVYEFAFDGGDYRTCPISARQASDLRDARTALEPVVAGMCAGVTVRRHYTTECDVIEIGSVGSIGHDQDD